ncbi:MAG: serpin family protein [Verrucomicrobiota bacterium]|jgi:serpin B
MSKKPGFGVLLCFAGLTVLAASPAGQEKLASANTGFAFDLLRQITREQPVTNVFISPFSVSSVLQMVANGAAGETKAEMQRVLKTTGLPAETLNAACKDLNQSLNSQTNVILNLANAIWYENWIHFTPAFVSNNQKCFQVKIAGVDSFTNAESADIINDWAEKNTHGKIKQVVRFPFPASTRVVLANAIYFKGKWAEPFDKSQTKPRDFHLSKGGEKQVPMMRQSRTFSYQEGDGFQAVRLPYAGDRLQMYLFLPATNSSPQKLLANFNSESWHNKILPQFSDRKGMLVFPKFKLDYNILLNDSLEALGMKCAFVEGEADFSRMVDNDNLFITMVKQKSFVDVNEEGTEAAAVTTVMLSDSVMSLRPPKPFEMIVDRPFLFVIDDDSTKSVLFMGVIYDPAG